MGLTVFAAVCSLKCEDAPPKGGEADNAAPGEDALAKAGREVAALRRELEVRNKTASALMESLELANAEADFFRRQWIDLRLRDEALGVEALTGDEAKLREKVVTAVRDLYQSERRRKEAAAQLAIMVEMLEAVLGQAKGVDAQLRSDVEAQLRLSQALLKGRGGQAAAESGTLLGARVLDYKPALGLAVLNVGWKEGAKSGMIFEISRGGRLIALARAVDVREAILGAMVEKTAERTVVVQGDDAKVSTLKSETMQEK